jgi:hypothetical protein
MTHLPRKVREILPETADKIFNSVKGLRDHMQPEEKPLLNIPAIWDNGQQRHSTACDVIVTNQRLLGYYFVTFPRERIFLDGLPLATIRAVTFRQKSFDPVFRELMVRTKYRVVYIRAPRQKIESLFAALRAASEGYAPAAETIMTTEEGDTARAETPTYGRQEIRRPFEGSSLNITMLFVGGLILEIIGIVLWSTTASIQIGLPLIGAGFISWLAAVLLRRQQR